ncbi:serine hydrolase domain-containing protein [Sandarakinorhabdus oryzae]|uniref:serine hydrolase domain-containing protein n=1 Tax=Sandarakinorhabdus oryzae TaxID=2675220 RepID=UPI0012E0CEB0|nr:serine hydrolase domain-containing protein [Sandarakinorhabdus oryzae]
MPIDRRLFLAGAAGVSMAGAASATLIAPGASAAEARALDAIAAYLEAHRRHYGLPAMGMVVVAGGRPFTILSGTRDYRETLPLAGDELWQIGSISKSFVALAVLSLQAEGKLTLDDELRQHLPEARLPGVSSGGPFSLRGLLDHTTGLPDFAPALGLKLWRGFAAGKGWSYSNTGYDLVGKALSRIEGKPLKQIIEERVCKPLGMGATRGAIQWRDRARYPASYNPMRPDRPVLLGMALAPAPWVDVDLGAGSVASTLPDMAKYLSFLIAVGQGRGGPILTDAQAKLWLANPVVEDPAKPAETYGLGLMHRQDEGRALLHHTGGMVCFSSSFHVDAAAGLGAFASCAVGGLNYRPRLITLYALRALRAAAAGAAIPAPPELGALPADAGDYVGSYKDGERQLDILPGLVAALDGQRVPLQSVAPGLFVTAHPGLVEWPLLAVRDGNVVVALDHGSRRFLRSGARAALPATPPDLAALAGHYQSDDPWIGDINLVARGDGLFMRGVLPLRRIGKDEWAPDEPNSPERLRFDGFVNGVPYLIDWSGRRLERRDL